MVSIIKNQLLKHLSRFTKNLSADKINLSTFKGEGELSNLQLDETVLTDLLELPSWLQLTSATCNKVAFRIQWTKLKSVPICLTLDEVRIEVETCEELRSVSVHQGLSSIAGPAKYSFINKVIDGMTVIVNTVRITFRSPAFKATVQILRILVESKSPNWQKCDLRMTRLKEPDRGQILIFKELEWQTVRIEANSTMDSTMTPLRLLTNHASCRIIIKKRLSDSLVLGSCLALILDDLLWVLTDSQLKAALCFVGSLVGLIQKATELTRIRKAARKIEMLPEYQAQISQQEHIKDSGSTLSRLFNRYDFIETSYHFLLKHIDLHLCDDPGDGRSVHPDLQDGGALQINLQQLQLDYYPYHLAVGNRKHWPVYWEEMYPHTQWLSQALSTFRARLLDIVDQGAGVGHHAPVGRTQQQNPNQQQQQQKNLGAPHGDSNVKRTHNTQPSSGSTTSGNPVKSYILRELSKLMTSCFVLRIKDFTLYQVTTTKRKQKPKIFIAGESSRLKGESTLVHAEFTYYYYPGDKTFPLPPPKFYAQLNPVQINFDLHSCVWANAFVLNLYQSLLLTAAAAQDNVSDLFYVDVKLEAIKIKVLVDTGGIEYRNQRDRPRLLQIQVERASVTNIRSMEHSSRADLAKCVDALQSAPLFYGASFPATPSDRHVVTEKFLKHLAGIDSVRPVPHVTGDVAQLEHSLSRTLLWTDARDVWCVSLEPVSASFSGAPADIAAGFDPVPLTDAFPLTLWAHWDATESVLNTLAHVPALVSFQLNHYQYLFLLRAMDRISETAAVMSVDSLRIQGNDGLPPTVILAGILLPQVEMTFVMASQTPGREYHGSADLESVVPDSASLADEGVRIHANSLSSSPSLEGPFDSRLRHSVPPNVVSYVDTVTSSLPVNSVQPLTGLSIPDNFNASISTVKKGWKGLSNMVTSLDSVLKASPDDLASETASQRSDASSDSERYLLEGQQTEGLDTMFRAGSICELWQPGLELASEVTEDIEKIAHDGSVSSPSDGRSPDDSTGKRRDLVSLATIKCGHVAVIQQSEGFHSILKLQIATIVTDECGAIPLDEFQSKFGCRSRVWSEVPASDEATPKIAVRFEHVVEPKREVHPRFWGKNKLQGEAHDLELELNMSSLIGLADFIEDEIIPEAVPMEFGVQNIKLQLNDDRPPSSITSPSPVPVNLKIVDILLKNDINRVLTVETRTDVSGMSNSNSSIIDNTVYESQISKLKQSNEELKAENVELKRRMAALEKIAEENCSLRQAVEDCQILRTCLITAQDDVARLLEEKRTLIDRLRAMQEQLDQPSRTKR